MHAPISLEATVAARNNPAWPDGVVHVAGSAAAQYVAALGQHVLGLAELLSSRQVILSGWPIVRAQLELAGRVGWLLETGTADGKRVTGEARVARSHMEALAALCRRRFSLGVMKAKRSTIKQVKSERDVLRKRTENLFDDAVLDWNDPGDEEEWNLGGEAYAGLGQGVRIFSRIALSDNKGTYDTLSDFAHPSLLTLTLLSKERPHDDHRTYDWTMGLNEVSWLARASATFLYGSSRLVAGYHGLDTRRLEEWGDQIEALIPVA